MKIKIGNQLVGEGESTYFIADIASNFDGSINRAKKLINLAAESGADAVKFQTFRAHKIVSDHGFKSLKDNFSHQTAWKKSVYQTYKDAELPMDWINELKLVCNKVGIDFFSTPYDLEAVEMLNVHVPVFKIGSGDITWPEMLRKTSRYNKPIILSTGASNICDVQRAVQIISESNLQIIIMQCNTNYTGNLENFHHIHLNVLKTYRTMFPNAVLGLSDHTFGHATVLGAVALGARVIEKHFTDDTSREGPDHHFSMTPHTWREMVDRTRELELSFGDANKRIVKNERETVILQRRCLRASKDLRAGTIITRKDLEVLRPAPKGAIMPYEMEKIIGLHLIIDLPKGEYVKWTMIEA